MAQEREFESYQIQKPVKKDPLYEVPDFQSKMGVTERDNPFRLMDFGGSAAVEAPPE